MSASTRIARALGIFSGVKILTILCSLVRNKIISVVIGPAGLGLMGLFNGIVDLVSQASRLSMDQSAQRDISQASKASAATVITVVRRWSFWLGMGGSILTCAISPLLSLISFDTVHHWPTFCLLAIVPIFYTFSACTYAENQGLRRFRALALSSILGHIVALIAAIPLIILLGIKSIAIIIVLYAVITGMAAWIFRPRIDKVAMATSEIVQRGKNFIKIGAQITIALVVNQTVAYAFILFINGMYSTDVLGIYQAGYQVMNSYVGIIFTVLWIEYFPRLSSLAHSPKRMALTVSHQTNLMLTVLVPLLALLVILVQPVVRLVYSSEFLPVTPYIVLACIGVVFRTSSYCLAYVVLARGDGKTYLLTEISSSVFGFAVNIAGFFLGGFLGLGIAYIVWYAFYTILLMSVCKRRYGVTLAPRTKTLVIQAAVILGLVSSLYLIL